MLKLTEEEKKRIDKKAVLELIKNQEDRLKAWSLNKYEKDKIKAEIQELKALID